MRRGKWGALLVLIGMLDFLVRYFFYEALHAHWDILLIKKIIFGFVYLWGIFNIFVRVPLKKDKQ